MLRRFSDKLLAAVISKESLGKDFLAEAEFMSIVQYIEFLIKPLLPIKEYDPMPKNPDGSIRWFLYRWDDGKNRDRHLARCRECGSLYLVQA